MTDLGTRYSPEGIEEKWYAQWEQAGYFIAATDTNKKPFCIVIPPPNITGILHMGHALNNTLQDVIARWRRMQGYNMLWLPGTDHASIATQNVVERELHKEGKRRQELGREEFLWRCWEWKEKYGGIIVQQLKRLGASCDWTRLRFTMDEGLARAVRTAFKRLYEEGLIYKGTYIINWCPRCGTALADDEVEHIEHQGHLWYIMYPLEAEGKAPKSESRYIVVATTRPETMLGDTAVAVNPKDPRYKHLIGKRCILPLLNRPLPIIADDYVQREFGTGALKITPAHDPNDYLIGKRHGLAEINIFTPDARINENGGPYKGLDRYECRKRVIADLMAQGLIEKIEDYQHSIGHCYRCDTEIEPYISLQWFVKMRPLAEPALQVVKEGKIIFIPSMWENTYFAWLENVRDWCISRQLWWGHRIPAWYCQACGNIEVESDFEPQSCSECGSRNLQQDEDVLDTWFSSALWPFSTLGWPEKTADLATFYPTNVLVTGHDIIFFWVARMIMMGLKFMQAVPFYEVYFNAIIYDEHGEKMSKSKGNAIDPTDVIREYGADSLRLTLCAYAAQGRNICLSAKRFEGYRNFLNKLWNASRFVLMNTADLDGAKLVAGPPTNALELADQWILSRFYNTCKEVNQALAEYKFNEVVNALYQFVWHQYCDWYVELVKPRLYSKEKPNFTEDKRRSRESAQIVLLLVLEGLLRLLHPVIPFITEEIWQILRERYGSISPETEQGKIVPSDFCGEMLSALRSPSIMIAPWLEGDGSKFIQPELEKKMSLIQELIYTIRNLRGEMSIPPGEAVAVKITAPDSEQIETIKSYSEYFTTLINLSDLKITDVAEEKESGFYAVGVVGDITVAVKLPEEFRHQEIRRLEKELKKLEAEESMLLKKLSNEEFIQRAPTMIVERERMRLTTVQAELAKIHQKWQELTACDQ